MKNYRLSNLIILVVSDASNEIGKALIEESIQVRAHFPQCHSARTTRRRRILNGVLETHTKERRLRSITMEGLRGGFMPPSVSKKRDDKQCSRCGGTLFLPRETRTKRHTTTDKGGNEG